MSEHPVYETILKRRSIRGFLDKEVRRDDIELMLKAAMAAPSACNLQPWSFVVVNEPELLAELMKCTEQGTYGPSLIIVVCGFNKHIPWQDESWRQDCGNAIQNILLEATELGLGSVCIGGFDDNAVSALLDIPDDIHPVCLVEIGYPAYEKEPLTWYTEEAVHWQKFDKSKQRTLRTLQMLRADAEAGII